MAVRRGPVPLGYLETKDVGKNLEEEERSAQLKRYRAALPNLILTDYLEFRWYVNGERRAVVSLGHVERDGRVKSQKRRPWPPWGSYWPNSWPSSSPPSARPKS